MPDDEEGNNNDVADDNNNNNKNKSDDSLSYFSSSQIGSSHIGSSPFGSSHIAYFEDEKQRNNEDIDNKELDNKGNTPLPPPPNARDNPGNQHLSKENGREFKSLSEESKVFLRSRGIPENLNYLAYLINIENLCKKSAIYRAGSEQVFLDWYVKAIAQSKSIPIEYLDEGVDQERVDMALALSWFSLGLVVDNHLIDEQILQFENCVSNHLKRFNEYKTSTLPYESGFTPEQYQIILLDRNLVWLDKFKKAHQNYNHIFLAGGAGHFIWKFNMLDMLRKEDFSVQRMNSSCSF